MAAAGAAGLVVVVALVAGRLVGDGTPPHPPGAPPEGLVAPGGPPPDAYAGLPGPVGRHVPWNWAVHVQANLWTADGFQYAIWVTPDGAPVVGRRSVDDPPMHHDAGGWDTFDLSTVPGNPLAAPTVADPHRVYAVAVDAAGHVHVAGNMHSSRLRYLRSTRPHDITAWQDAGMVDVDEDAVSYPTFVAGPERALLFFYRDGSSRGGDLVLNTLPADGGTWQRTGVVLAGRKVHAAPYPQHIHVDERGRLHLLHVWRVAAGAEGNRFISYIVSPDGGDSWETVEGRALPTPVGIDPAAVAVTVPDDIVVVNQGGAATDADGRPAGAFLTRAPSGAPGPLWLLRHDGTHWQVDEVAGSGRAGGRPALIGHDRGLLLVWPADGADASTVVHAAEVGRGRRGGPRALLRLPVADWEPVYDRQVVADGRLQLVVPVGSSDARGEGRPDPRTPREGREGAGAAVVTYRIDRLMDRRRRHARASSAGRRADGAAAAHRRSSPGSTRPSRAMVAPASAMNTARCCGAQASHACARATAWSASRP